MSARIDAGMTTRKEAADYFDMPVSTYESHENGNRATKGIPIENARMYARKFRVSLAWLLTGQGDKKFSASVEIKGFIGAGAEIEDFDGSGKFEELSINVKNPDDFEWYEVVGDSMEPRVYAGEFIAFERRDYSPQELLRQACLVYLESGVRYFKVLNPGAEPGLYDLFSYNDKSRPDQKVRKVARVGLIVARPRAAGSAR